MPAPARSTCSWRRGRTQVSLGLVSTKRPETEDADELLRRLDEAAQHVPAERLALSTQCGFASADTGANLLTEDQQWAKLANLSATAGRFWS
jgi:5-methyltetrahydropteroyltriglutamate--homocysteine methyltransferase